MKFWKMNGAGNDFLIINNLSGKIRPEQWPQIAQTVCERHRSVGADGLMAVEKSDSADYKMLFFNSDGSMGEMCGNGARCICRYGYETGLAGEVQHVETTAGLVTGWRMDARMYRVRLNDPTHIELDGRADIDGKTYRYAYVELGDPCIPHAVVEIPGLRTCNEDALRGEVSGRGVRVDMTGGRLIIDVEYDEGRVENLYLTGPTNIVCKGELTDEELVL